MYNTVLYILYGYSMYEYKSVTYVSTVSSAVYCKTQNSKVEVNNSKKMNVFDK